jgi:PadR family transcriptional regulator, regulatory protein AphA
MDIQYAILGLLHWKPMSGYDLKKGIAESDLFYWSGNNNQIYNSLVQLHKDGLVTQEIQLQESLPARKIYTITPAGRDMLNRWALSAPELPEVHHNFLIQLAWTDLLTDQQLDALLGQYETEITVQLRMRQEQRNRGTAAPDRSPREKYLWRKINAHILAGFERELEWVRQVRSGLPNEQEETIHLEE